MIGSTIEELAISQTGEYKGGVDKRSTFLPTRSHTYCKYQQACASRPKKCYVTYTLFVY